MSPLDSSPDSVLVSIMLIRKISINRRLFSEYDVAVLH